MPEAGGPAPAAAAGERERLPLCASSALAERGLAVSFPLRLWREQALGFALRIDGRVVAYVNRCVHVPTEMDWQPGRFLDHESRFIVCSLHGATYDPADGRCVGGPCGRGRLRSIETAEEDGQVYWYPSQEVRPEPPRTPDPGPEPGA